MAVPFASQMNELQQGFGRHKHSLRLNRPENRKAVLLVALLLKDATEVIYSWTELLLLIESVQARKLSKYVVHKAHC